MGTEKDARELLRGASLRVTKPRVAVVEAVEAHPHADTESVIAAVREALPDVSHQAVYDSLRVLSDLGILRKIQPAGSVARYEARVADNHHHLVCRECGEVLDVDCVVGEAPCLTPSEAHGYRIDEAEVIFWGVCPSCAENHGADGATNHGADGAETHERGNT